jgi:hypothetical protein
MPVLTATRPNTAKTNYVPPAFRSTAAPSTKKTELKKGFALEQTAFPSLGETLKKSQTQGTPISFSSAAAKKTAPQLSLIPDVLPGWVHIRKYQGKFQYKYGKPIVRSNEEYEREEEIRSRIILNNRITREEYDRMRDIERLGDLSEFYGQPTLAEMYEQAMEAAIYYENESSDYTDSDQYE